MPRSPRPASAGIVTHVLNRSNARRPLFEDDGDYELFEHTLEQAHARTPVRILSYGVMPNHWHLVLWPRRGTWSATPFAPGWSDGRRIGHGPACGGGPAAMPTSAVCWPTRRAAGRPTGWDWSIGRRRARNARPWRCALPAAARERRARSHEQHNKGFLTPFVSFEQQARASGEAVYEGVLVERQRHGRYVCHCERANPLVRSQVAERTEMAFSSAEDAARFYLRWGLHLPGDLDGWKVVE